MSPVSVPATMRGGAMRGAADAKGTRDADEMEEELQQPSTRMQLGGEELTGEFLPEDSPVDLAIPRCRQRVLPMSKNGGANAGAYWTESISCRRNKSEEIP